MNKKIVLLRMPVFFIITAILCDLKPIGLLLVGGLSILLLFVLDVQEKKEADRQSYLEESAFYMEQLIYSFRKHHKIQAALRDVALITEGKLNQSVVFALDRLEQHSVEENLFRYALDGLEEVYGSNLMHTLHVFLIRVEEQGGDCSMALGLLLNQLREWKKSQKAFISRKKKIQSRLVLSVVLSCLICMSVVRMMPSSCIITELLFYQICTGTGLIVFQLLYLVFRTMGSGLEKIGLERIPAEGRKRRQWKRKNRGQKKKKHPKKEQEAEWIEMLYARMDSPVHGIRYWNTVRRLEQQIRFAFPEWMFDMILRLQTENVQTAVSHSLDDAPEVLVRPLYRMLDQMQADPVSVRPFLNFLKEFDLPEIHGVMLQLYAINDMGRGEIQEQIYTMLDQNQKMSEVSVELKADSILSGMGMMAALPMMTAVLVLIIDLSLMLFSFLGGMYHI